MSQRSEERGDFEIISGGSKPSIEYYRRTELTFNFFISIYTYEKSK